MELRTGYKQTELGVIPKDWEISAAAKITTVIGDGIHTTPQYSENGEFAFINGNNLDSGSVVIYKTTKRVQQEEYKKYRKELNDRTLLMSINGTIGQLAIYRGEPILLGKSAAYLNVKENFSRKYLYYYLNTSLVSAFFENELTGTTIRNLGLGSIRNTPICYPSSPIEQRAIATALSDVDGLIGALDKLIAKKRDIKLAAMQQLLTGKTRLPGSDGEWEYYPLSAVCKMETGRRPKGGVTEEGDVPSLGGENIHNDNGLKLDVVKRVSEAFFNAMHTGVLRDQDVIINKDGANTGKVGLYANAGFDKACVNEHLFILRGGGRLDNRFLYAIICLESVRQEIGKHIASSAQPGLNRRFLDVVVILVPEIEEQRAIATVLSDMDAGITTLELRRKKTKAIKQGMMQALLTGRVRLVKREASA